MKLKILITKGILEQSKNCTSQGMIGQNCAIGLAIFALFGAKSWVGQYSIDIYDEPVNNNDDFMENSPINQIILPDIAVEFIKTFDIASPEGRVRIAPISFDIDIPENVIDILGLSYIHQVVELQPELELS